MCWWLDLIMKGTLLVAMRHSSTSPSHSELLRYYIISNPCLPLNHWTGSGQWRATTLNKVAKLSLRYLLIGVYLFDNESHFFPKLRHGSCTIVGGREKGGHHDGEFICWPGEAFTRSSMRPSEESNQEWSRTEFVKSLCGMRIQSTSRKPHCHRNVT